MVQKSMIVSDPTKKTKKDMKKGKGKKLYAKASKAPPAGEDGAPKRRKKVVESYRRYIQRVLRQIVDKGTLSSRAMNIMNSFCNDMFDRIAVESMRLLRTSKRRVLSPQDVECAVKLLLPGELQRHAISEASKAVSKFAGRD
mmetsp:Transcript_7359/g.16097  ORF Transcript_7359/g.16097 Transcript_7359/m.16097 type:complete len:142 (-) Transcript_7359:210-635(-)